MSELSNLKCKQKFRGFPEGKTFNRRKVLIREFHKKMLKVIREKKKLPSTDRSFESCIYHLQTGN